MKRLLQQLGEKGSRYDPDALAYFNQLTGSLPVSFKNAVNTYVRALKAAGIWTQLDRLWLHATPNQQNARISIVNPTSTPITEVNAPTWTANLGYTGNGATMYLNTNFNPGGGGVNFVQNSASFGVYCRTNNIGTTETVGADNSFSYSTIYLRYTGNVIYSLLNNAAAVAGIINNDSRGFYSTIRIIPARLDVYKNGNAEGSEIQASNGVPNVNFFILCRNSNGVAFGFDDKQISLSFFGGGSIDQAAFYTATQALAVAIGFNV